MGRYLKYLIVFIFFFIFINRVEAIRFYEGNFISGEYVSKKKDGVIYYMTMKYLIDGNGNPVYCVEPFVKFNQNDDYELSNPYLNYSSDVIRRIELISYYGYGYKHRTGDKWYVITQYLIWNTIAGDNVYFTDKLNGKRIDKYVNEINEILYDVNLHDVFNLSNNYKVNLGDKLNIDLSNYEIIDSSIDINNVTSNGFIKVRKISNNYGMEGNFFDGVSTQDLYLRGNVSNLIYEIGIEVIKGNILLDVRVDKILEDYKVCYQIYSEDVLVDNICSNVNGLYKSIDLKYGNYKVIQSYISNGYVIDSNEYYVSLGNDEYLLKLDNYVIRNNLVINKYYCFNSECNLESDAKFEIYDSSNNLVGEIITDSNGNGVIELVYGEYLIKQVSGINGFNYVNDFKVNIDDIDYSYVFNLSSNREVVYEVPSPPNTYVERSNLILFFIGLYFYKKLIIYIEGRLNK